MYRNQLARLRLVPVGMSLWRNIRKLLIKDALLHCRSAPNWHILRSCLEPPRMSENTYHHLPSRFRTANAASPATRRLDCIHISHLYLTCYIEHGATALVPVPWQLTSGGQLVASIFKLHRVGDLCVSVSN
jgi:hypothetical protein